jgi:hypothetical protein
MFLGSTMLEVIIGLVFVFSLISLLATAIQEFIARIFALRSRNLKAGIKNLLAGDDDLRKALYDHPLIAALGNKTFNQDGGRLFKLWNQGDKAQSKPKWGGPEYIPSRTFAIALLDQLKEEAAKVDTAPLTTVLEELGQQQNPNLEKIRQKLIEDLNNASKDVKSAIQLYPKSEKVNKALAALIDAPGQSLTADAQELVKNLPEGPAKQQLLAYLTSTSASVDSIVKSVEAWYDDVMKQVLGWYKRKAQLILLVIGFAIAIGGNIDTISIYSALSRDATLRAAIVQSAGEFVQSPPAIPTPMPAESVESGEAITNTGALTNTGTITETETQIVQLQQKFQALNLPAGWVLWPPETKYDCSDINKALGCSQVLRPVPWTNDQEKVSLLQNLPSKIVGWLVTALAVTIGAPFWFDLLSKLVNLRSGFKPPDEDSSKKE